MLQMFVLALSLYNTWNRGVFLLCKITNLLIYSIGNNDTDLYSYFKEHGELPDIMTVRRFSGTDAQDLQPYLMDFASYDVVSKYYSYAVEYYKDTDDEIQWLPICAIPQTIIANKTLFDQYGIKVPENYEEYV